MNIIIYRKVYVKDIYMVYRDKDRLLYMKIRIGYCACGYIGCYIYEI